MQCSSSEKYVIIVAGGSGKRMNAAVEKQFLPLGKSVVLLETLKAVHQSEPSANLILVLPKERFDFWNDICRKYGCTIPHRLVEGGKERFFSVKAAVDSISCKDDNALVAVHDGVRPFVDVEVFGRCFAAAEESGAAVACIDASDSVRYEGRAIDRSKVKLVQTPQCFKLSILKKAYEQEYDKTLTDDASLVESLGVKVRLVEGNERNIKLTRPLDLLIAENLINGR